MAITSLPGSASPVVWIHNVGFVNGTYGTSMYISLNGTINWQGYVPSGSDPGGAANDRIVFPSVPNGTFYVTVTLGNGWSNTYTVTLTSNSGAWGLSDWQDPTTGNISVHYGFSK